ncbi:MAG: hypothetical protein K0R19_1101 [Bacillota bacterium]|jgi:hypothetical protein|nr:hypothetical protein [Bacillota bacterium]
MSVTRKILEGFIDMHVHAGPSVATRKVDAAQMLIEAENAGYRAFLVKDHYFPTMMGTRMVTEHLGKEGCLVFGGIALNNSVGAFNLNALDAAYGLGAKTVYMPTVSALNHIVGHSGDHFVGSGDMEVEDKGIVYLNEDGSLDPAVIKVLEYIAKRPDLILCTGHGSAAEVDALIENAVRLGVQKIVVNHPHFLVNATYEQMKKWSDMGAFIELNAAVFSSIAKSGKCPDEMIGKILEFVRVTKIVLDSDLGQKVNIGPVEGMYAFICKLVDEFGVTEEQINIMGKKNPAMLLGLDN